MNIRNSQDHLLQCPYSARSELLPSNPARSWDSTLRQNGLLKGGSVVNSRLAVAKAENSPVSRDN